NCNLNGATPILIRRIQDLINRNCQIQFKHTRREENRSANWLLCLMMLEIPPRELQDILFDDISRTYKPKIVRIAP
ncbi:hypothetical protein A2U01_0037049, partial [Trifolium medium]|nr:hypothetical protein [Trifolium medium]